MADCLVEQMADSLAEKWVHLLVKLMAACSVLLSADLMAEHLAVQLVPWMAEKRDDCSVAMSDDN